MSLAARPPTRARAALLTATLALALLWPALRNGYPFVYSDTGAYLDSGFLQAVPIDRPVAYGLFLWLASAGRTLWVPTVVQALLVAAALVAAWSAVGPARGANARAGGLAVALALLAATPLAVEASLLIPDFTTPLALLAVGAVAAAPRLTPLAAAAWSGLLLFTLAAHLSNLSVVTVAAVLLLAAGLLGGRFEALRALRARAALLVAVAAAGWVGIAALNGALGAPRAVSRAGAAFYAARLVQIGLLDDVLAAECPRTGWNLCDAQRDLPATGDEFLWGDERSPFRRHGGFENREALSQIARSSFSRPDWVAAQASAAVQSTARQLTLGETAPWLPSYGAEYWYVGHAIARHVPADRPRMLAAGQQRGTIQGLLHALDRVSLALEPFALLALVALLAWPRTRARIPPSARLFVLVVLGGVALNAAVCASLSNPHDRYHARVLPLILLCAGLASTWARANPAAPAAGRPE